MRHVRFGISIASIAAAGLFLGLSFAAAPAGAQPRQIDPEQACRDDAFRLCNNFIPDRARVGACLRANRRGLSPDCRTVVFGGGRHVGRRHGGTRHHRRHH